MKRIAAIIAGVLLGTTAFPQVTATLLLPVGADTSAANKNYLNFYFGAMMAARDLGRDSLQINLEAIDILSKDFPSFGNKMRIAQSDIIIGPINAEDILSVREFLPYGTPIVSPLNTKTLALCDSIPVILANTPSTYQNEDALSWILSDLESSRDTVRCDSLIVISEAEYEENELCARIREALDTVETRTEISYKISQGVEIIDTFNIHCHLADTTTRCYAVSDRDLFVKDALRQVAEQSYKGKDIIFYGTGRVRSSDIAELCAGTTHMSTTFFVDYTDPRVQNFIFEYRAFFGCDPDSFAFHGYDVLHFFANICRIYGKEWPKALSLYSESGFQTNFNFKGTVTPNSGAVNTAVRRVLFTKPFSSTIVY